SSRRRHTRSDRDWSSDVCSSDLHVAAEGLAEDLGLRAALLSGNPVGLPDEVGGQRGWGRLRRRASPAMYSHRMSRALVLAVCARSEERRVGKECRAGWWAARYRK